MSGALHRGLAGLSRSLIGGLVAAMGGTMSASAQSPPSTDIYLAPLSMKNGTPAVGIPVNITNRPGYDNQPSFTPDGKAILFTSTHDDGQSDIYRYDVAARTISRVTHTPESEYSALVMPGGKRFSVIRVERDSAQRLWSFAIDGSDPRLVIKGLKPVGYHTWIDANNLALFVLGRPNALVHSDLRTGKSDTLLRDIGRSLATERSPTNRRAAKAPAFYFTHRVDSASMLSTIRLPGGRPNDLIAMPVGAQDFALIGPGVVLTSLNTTLLVWRAGDDAWTEIADLSAAGLTKISRLAVSPDGKWLAIVAEPTP
jgi:dipeptidyl aminopeptidase/acylaminoacyl peptidase